jgi:hypothetical protein
MVARLAETPHWNQRQGKGRPTCSNHQRLSKTSRPTMEAASARQSNEAMLQTTSIPETLRLLQTTLLKGRLYLQLD